MLFNRFFIFFSIITSLSLNALTLDEALNNAIEINPEIKEKEKRYKEIYYDIEMAKAGYLPKIDLLGASSLYDSREDQSTDKLYDLEIALTQNIFNGFGDINKHRLELSKYKSAFYTTKELINRYSFEAIQAYLTLLKEKEMHHIQKSSVENHENIFNKITIKYNSGLGTKLELRLSNTSLYLAKINYHEQKNAITQAKIALEKFLNKEIDLSELIYPIHDVKIPKNYEEALEIALKFHPSMYIAKLNRDMSSYELEYIKKDLYPTLDFKANYYNGEDGMYKTTLDEHYKLNLNLSYNIYNGHKDISSKRKIEQKLLQKQLQIEKVKRDITHKLKSKYNAYLLLKEKKELLDKYVVFKGLTLDSYYDEFSIGKAQLRDILDTTESLYAAKKMQLEGDNNLLISKYSVLEAMGVLPEIKYEDYNSLTTIKVLDSSDYNENNVNKFTDIKIEFNSTNIDDSNKSDVTSETSLSYNIDNKDKERLNTKDVGMFCYTVIANILHIRMDASISSEIIGTYKNGEIICSYAVENNWVKTYDGWVYKEYLKIYSREK